MPGADQCPKDIDAHLRELAFTAGGCRPRSDFGDSDSTYDTTPIDVRHHDLTGDGVDEVVAVFQCPASTSGWPNAVVAFDVSGTSPKARVIGVLGQEADIVSGPVTMRGGEVTMTGPSLVGESPSSPSHHATLVYSWNGTRMKLTHRTETADGATVERVADGTFHAYLLGVGDGSVTYDQVQWFEGAAATAACRQDGVSVESQELCHDYYVRNTSTKARTVGVSASARVSYLDSSGDEHHLRGDSLLTLASLGLTTAQSQGQGALFDLVVTDGSVSALQQVYTP